MQTESDSIGPREAAQRLRHLINLNDVGVVMANTASISMNKSIAFKQDTPVAFHSRVECCYVGHLLEGGGDCNIRFPVRFCRPLTELEVANFEAIEEPKAGATPF